MHEISLMENALAIALDYAHRDQASRIHTLRLRIGSLSSVDPEALRFAFEVITQNTIAADAQLEIEACPTRCYCSTCQQDFEPLDLGYECPHCRQWSTTVVQGKELELAAVEVS
ncbi:hydrogenase maturation nickel metallochaperone HypA [Lyngbya confervoides]|uniref:Hydrogenase maturation factor HypA n=1 Tax=Lyngbya confervoides BDU141951 TaxID=1574623 RepID=A0ABD4T0W3_9CYAN|nr:hydrogenase maturation nickel metallochaperone HypA [Lyngbya confervoides]MCM1982133.1 hydrogenase maturation nickel metallochaperone HypA [Lyngbya confervoides BDU141951]